MDAARGHLPLTSALRGTSLIKEIFAHPLWEEDGEIEGGRANDATLLFPSLSTP